MSDEGYWQGEGWYRINRNDGGQGYEAYWYESADMLGHDLVTATGDEAHPAMADYQGSLDAPLDCCEGFLASIGDAEQAVRDALGGEARDFDIEGLARAYYDHYDADSGFYAIPEEHCFWDVAREFDVSSLPEVIVGEPEYVPSGHDWEHADEVVTVTLHEHGHATDSRDFVVPYGTPGDIAVAALEDCRPLPDGTSIEGTIVELLAAHGLTADGVTINGFDLSLAATEELGELAGAKK